MPGVLHVLEGEHRLPPETLQGEDEILQRAAEAEEGVGEETARFRFI